MRLANKLKRGEGVSPVDRMFLKWNYAKRPDPNSPTYNNEMWIYIFKFYSTRAYFGLMEYHFRFIKFITKYYPFSLLYQDRLLHHKNQPISKFLGELEKVAAKSKIDIIMVSGEYGDQLTDFYGDFSGRVKDREVAAKQLEKIFQEEYGTIFVKNLKDCIQVSISTETLQKITKYN